MRFNFGPKTELSVTRWLNGHRGVATKDHLLASCPVAWGDCLIGTLYKSQASDVSAGNQPITWYSMVLGPWMLSATSIEPLVEEYNKMFEDNPEVLQFLCSPQNASIK
jgi:hypothetical protein